MPPAAIASISSSGTEPAPFHMPGMREHAHAARLRDQRERVQRMQGVLRHPRAPAVGDELLGERRLLVRDDARLHHGLRHVRASDRVAAGDLAHAVELDRVAELLELLDHQLAAAEPRVGEPRELGRAAPRSRGRSSTRGRGGSPPRTRRRTRSRAPSRSGRPPPTAASSSPASVSWSVIATPVSPRSTARSTTSVGVNVPSERFVWAWRSYPVMTADGGRRVARPSRGSRRART